MQLQTVNLSLLGVMLARKLDIWLEFAYLRTSRKLQDKGVVGTKMSSSFKTAVAIVMRVIQKSRKGQSQVYYHNFINGVRVDIEADSEAERSTIPWSVFQDKLSMSVSWFHHQ